MDTIGIFWIYVRTHFCQIRVILKNTEFDSLIKHEKSRNDVDICACHASRQTTLTGNAMLDSNVGIKITLRFIPVMHKDIQFVKWVSDKRHDLFSLFLLMHEIDKKWPDIAQHVTGFQKRDVYSGYWFSIVLISTVKKYLSLQESDIILKFLRRNRNVTVIHHKDYIFFDTQLESFQIV